MHDDPLHDILVTRLLVTQKKLFVVPWSVAEMADFIELSSGIPMWETAKYTGGHDEIVCELSEVCVLTVTLRDNKLLSHIRYHTGRHFRFCDIVATLV